MAKKLDKTRDYGEVFGMAGAVYEQDGAYFDNAGNPVGTGASTALTDTTPDQFTAMTRDELIAFLVDHGESQYNPNGPDDDLRAVCREVITE